MLTISRDSKLAFYSVLCKQHVYIAQAEVIDAALQMVQVNILGGKGWALLLAKYMQQKRRNHFAT